MAATSQNEPSPLAANRTVKDSMIGNGSASLVPLSSLAMAIFVSQLDSKCHAVISNENRIDHKSEKHITDKSSTPCETAVQILLLQFLSLQMAASTLAVVREARSEKAATGEIDTK